MGALEELLQNLVSIDSVNPDLVPGGSGEGRIAAFVADWLKEHGLDVRVEETARPGRPNVIAVARGSGGGRSLMLNAHMDTVGVAGMVNPFSAEVRDGRLHGRGAMDTKAALAAFMSAAAAAREIHLRGDVILTAVVDEEFASVGTEEVVRRWKADAAIVGEPTGLDIVTEHKGFVWFEVETSGVAAHGSLPDEGVDAIAMMGRVVVAFDEHAAELRRGTPHFSLGTGSMHASLIRGGQELSSYPASCILGVERRTIPGEDVDAIERRLNAILDGLRQADSRFRAVLRRTFVRQPLEAPRDASIAQTLARQVRSVTGKEAEFSGMSGWLDSALIAGAGIPTVVFGPDGDGLHGKEEWVDLASVRSCRDVIVGTAGEFCR